MRFISQPRQDSFHLMPSQTMLVPPAIHLHGEMMILIQERYESGLSLNYLRAVPPIYYDDGFNLQSAFVGDFSNLPDGDQPAWTSDIRLPPKLAIVFWFPRYPIYKHQVTVLRAHNQPPTRGKLARIVAREMKRFLDKARIEYRLPLCCDGQELSLSDLFLIDIEHISRGSLQSRIGTRRYMGREASGLVHPMNTYLVPSFA
ncbi:hypothetical protein LXA43DRAFT_155001 [Ganoderma leucocontextum]|nr:hypothetical protein LXA43DRAFT_155001 [Ganoderma leucocontextum]